ncbi:sigma 54-interacting transcriptional regulator [Desnuesiella massiliensis]|uniref:sigma 54-interacting transcriptional regulator n=1 Tax=Desnuesiella massiliensis TaxID=1650662 RepID=UPI0006E22932|nr:sigma-54-dependent transcriptional regulator [Desnuesiella massiliensis]
MKRSEDIVYEYLKKCCENQKINGEEMGCSTKEIADGLELQRTNVSTILNRLCEEERIIKLKSKPVLYSIIDGKESQEKVNMNFDMLIGSSRSLKKSIQQAKAAILYPPKGLHTLLLGPTGVGKTMFAELMYKFAVEKQMFSSSAPFIHFNCADYANNSQLLLAHLFGCKKGAFTGADRDRLGMVDKADGGILFLDEVHRLPPEGQEMLFMLIDKGIYTPLGDIDNKKNCEIMIICATTEDADSSLLNTFTRRIPMTISIPSLKERSLEERFELIGEFFKIESRRIGREIIVSTNTLRSLLLYNCLGNIGQLRSDIQLGCANAFLKCISKGEKKIRVYSTDFSNSVKQGLILYKNYGQVVDKLVKEDMKMSFTPKGGRLQAAYDDYSLPNSFYDDIEKRIQELQERGIEEEEINFIMFFDIENYFKKYIRKFEKGVKKEELSKIVDNKIITLVENYLEMASDRLKKIFSTKVFYGLCLHISSSIERIRLNKNIINHNLKDIIDRHPDEYAIALHFSSTLEKEFNIRIPLDEVGFIAMFLCVDEPKEEGLNHKPVVVIAMHGKSTASSMAEVANKLVGGENVYGYDMPLDKSPKVAYEEIKEVILKYNQGAGVLLLVDMGSLGMFGELISEETGIEIRVIDMVTTVIAIECARKALTEKNIHEIWEETKNSLGFLNTYTASMAQTYIPNKDNIIITLCTTGEGSAIKLKNMIEQRINLSEKDIQVIPMAISDKQHMYNSINKLNKDKKLLAIVGTINPNIYGVPFISTSELFMDNNYGRLKEIVDNTETLERFYNSIFEALAMEITELDISRFKPQCIKFIDTIQGCIEKKLDKDKVVGIILHLACAITRLLSRNNPPVCYMKDKIIADYTEEFMCIKKGLKIFEDSYNIGFSEDEACFIVMIILSL